MSEQEKLSLSDSEQLRRRNRELSILNEIAKALNRSVDLDDALQQTLARVVDLLELQTGWIWLLHEESGDSYLAAAQNLPPALRDNPRRMEGGCHCLDTYQAGDLEGAANVNVITCSRLFGLVDGTDGLRYHSSIPLYAHGRKLGVMNVASRNWRELSPEDLRLLYTVGDLLGMAIERIRLYSKSMQIGAVEERNRLAREIHDTLAQGLSAVTLHLESADALLDSGAEEERVQRAVRQALSLTRANLEEARRSVLDLRAAPLEGRTLAEALSALGDELAERKGVAVSFSATGGSRPLPVRVEAGLYRMAQEALNNVVQHADAQRVTMLLVNTPQEVRLTVEDDGRGFDADQVPGERYGLVGLNERARLLGGRLHLQTSPGEGTRVEVSIPSEAI
ncbi:MAG TPA: GAF domain-containing sensor histidine kinase [Candidatus Sulfomarinibacteraceae bacterium]|nr:GAF domain-containing sensor histidine kinase [Candidatus Sulfomarinibacteraceae bacterium]